MRFENSFGLNRSKWCVDVDVDVRQSQQVWRAVVAKSSAVLLLVRANIVGRVCLLLGSTCVDLYQRVS